MLERFLLDNIYAVSLVFARIGTTFYILPGVGDTYISPQIRLGLALAMSLMLTPVLQSLLPPAPPGFLDTVVLISLEMTIGLFVGVVVRFMFAAVDVAGMIIASQTGLSAATAFNPAAGSQGPLISSFLMLLVMVVMYATDMHHLLFLALADSYTLLPPGKAPPVGDMADMLARLMSDSFAMGLRLAAPFLVIGTVFGLGMGLLARLMPQLQVFFISQPLQIAVGMAMFAATLQMIIMTWLEYFQQQMTSLFQGL
jgi:flagellar biosynthesis protein FliR